MSRLFLFLVAALLSACAALPSYDPLRVDVVGIDPEPGQGLELRLAVRLRIQNPNETAVEYDGAALALDVDGRTLASGVSSQRGTLGRFSETVLTIPVTISALNALRQAMVLADGKTRDSLPYVLHGKLAGGLFGTVRFTKEGELRLPAGAGR